MVSQVNAGRSVTLKRNPAYWGRDLAINRGLWNFDEIRYDYYRDANSHFEAFTKGLYDVRSEHDPGRWETAYDMPAVRDGRIIKELFPTGLPKGLSGFVFNTRRPVFADIRVREAIGAPVRLRMGQPQLLLRPLSPHRQLFRGLGAVRARPARRRARTRPARAVSRCGQRADVLDGTYEPPVTDDSGRDRETLKRALALFAEAGYELDGTELRARATGKPFSFEILVTTKDQERLAHRVLAQPQARRHHAAHPRRRRRAIRSPPGRLTIST